MTTLSQLLKPHASTPDARRLLAHVLNVPLSYLYAHDGDVISKEDAAFFSTLLARRHKGEPLAYLTGQKAFYSCDFIVTPDVLIPRSDTECLVAWVLAAFGDKAMAIADLGTGSGCIACVLGHERKNWQVLAVDESQAALAVAKINVAQLGLTNVACQQGNWCDGLADGTLDLIIANPPYIAEGDLALDAEVKHFEPSIALIAKDGGMADLKKIADDARRVLKPGGWLVMEHGYMQGAAVRAIMVDAGYCEVETHQDLVGHERFVVARCGLDVVA